MSLIEKLESIPRRYFNYLLIIAIIIPLLYPLGIPLSVSTIVKTGYDTIESTPDGSYVVYVNHLSATMIPETGPGGKALLQHLFNKNLKIIIVSFLVEGPVSYDAYLKPYLKMNGKEYGVDYVHLGYIAGAEKGMMSFANDVRSVVNEDNYGTQIDELSIMDNFNSMHDAALLVAVGSGYMENTVSIIQPVALTPIIVQGSAGGATGAMAFYPDTIKGLLTGIKGGAEYEYLIGRPGRAISSIDAVQMGTLLIVAFVVIGNILEFTKQKGGSK